MFELIDSIEMVVRIIHESALGKPTIMKNESNATISQHLCLIIYGMARTLPTKYNLEPVTVSTYNVMKYATHSINDDVIRALLIIYKWESCNDKHNTLYVLEFVYIASTSHHLAC
jgi:hypothetical protein